MGYKRRRHYDTETPLDGAIKESLGCYAGPPRAMSASMMRAEINMERKGRSITFATLGKRLKRLREQEWIALVCDPGDRSTGRGVYIALRFVAPMHRVPERMAQVREGLVRIFRRT